MGVSYGKLWLRLEKPTAEAKHRQRDDPYRIIVVGMEGAGKSTMMHQLRLGEVQSVVPTLGVHLEKIEHTDVSIVSWDLVPLDEVRRMHREACVGRCSEAGGPQDGFSTLLLFSLSHTTCDALHVRLQILRRSTAIHTSKLCVHAFRPQSNNRPSLPPCLPLPLSLPSAQVRAMESHFFRDTSVLVFVVDSADRGRVPAARQELHRLLESAPGLDQASLLVVANKQDFATAMSPSELVASLGLSTLKGRQWQIQGTATDPEGGAHVGMYEAVDWLTATVARRAMVGRAKTTGAGAGVGMGAGEVGGGGVGMADGADDGGDAALETKG
jgi:GTPase SAR1 family protein